MPASQKKKLKRQLSAAVRILGIDPGSSRCGYGLIEKQGWRLNLIKAGLIEIKESDSSQRLFYLGKDFERLLKKLKPDLVAIEKIFFTKNVKTAIAVAQARGLLLYLITKYQLPITEFTPNQVKRAVTNYGSADKKAVAKMVRLILGERELKEIDDTTDALAVAITAAGLSTDPLTATAD